MSTVPVAPVFLLEANTCAGHAFSQHMPQIKFSTFVVVITAIARHATLPDWTMIETWETS
jgi:hypothetical protein